MNCLRLTAFAPVVKRILKTIIRSKRPGWRVLRIVVLVVATLMALIMAFEDKFIYFPARYPEGRWDVAERATGEGEVGPDIEDCWLLTGDGVRLHGWHCSPSQYDKGSPRRQAGLPTLLFLHGNAGNVTDRYELIRMLMAIPAQVFIIDYRGYGRSEGKPSETGLHLDATSAWEFLTRERKLEPDRILIFGESLGCAPAIELATAVMPAGLILQSGFTSIRDMAASVLPGFPSFLLRTKMDSIGRIAGVRCPKLFIHSPADEVVPYEQGRRLFAAAIEPKRFYEVPGAGHNDTYMVGGEAYVAQIREFVRYCLPSYSQEKIRQP